MNGAASKEFSLSSNIAVRFDRLPKLGLSKTKMSGWAITIFALPPEEIDNALCYEVQQAAILAHWQVSALGTQWLDQLVQQGKAQQLKYSGYPCCWQSTAGAVLPLLQSKAIEPASDKVRPLWMGAITQYPERIASCSDEQVLTIEAWDLD